MSYDYVSCFASVRTAPQTQMIVLVKSCVICMFELKDIFGMHKLIKCIPSLEIKLLWIKGSAKREKQNGETLLHLPSQHTEIKTPGLLLNYYNKTAVNSHQIR